MQIALPWTLIAIFISFYLFYYFNQTAKINREEKRERLKEKHQKYLDSLLKSLSKNDQAKKEEN